MGIGMLPLVLGLYIMLLEPQVCWRTHQTLVPHASQTHCRRGEMVYYEMREGFGLLGR